MPDLETIAHLVSVIEDQNLTSQRLEAIIKGLQDTNRQLLATNIRLNAEVQSIEVRIESSREHADSLI